MRGWRQLSAGGGCLAWQTGCLCSSLAGMDRDWDGISCWDQVAAGLSTPAMLSPKPETQTHSLFFVCVSGHSNHYLKMHQHHNFFVIPVEHK